MLSLGEDLIRAFFVRWGIGGRIWQRYRTVAERGHSGLGCCCGVVDFLSADDLDFSIWAFAKDRALHNLAVGLALQNFAIEADVRIKK